MGVAELNIVLLSFIWAAALTHLLECLRDLWAARDRVRPSSSQLGWIAAGLVLVITSWLPLPGFGERLQGTTFLLLLAYAIVLFFMSAMMSPKVPETGDLDLAAYEDREGAAYKLAVAALGAISIALNWRLHHLAAPRETLTAFLPTQWFVGLMTLAALASLVPQPRRLRVVWAILILLLSLWVLLENTRTL